jgi:hypothetical protein
MLNVDAGRAAFNNGLSGPAKPPVLSFESVLPAQTQARSNSSDVTVPSPFTSNLPNLPTGRGNEPDEYLNAAKNRIMYIASATNESLDLSQHGYKRSRSLPLRNNSHMQVHKTCEWCSYNYCILNLNSKRDDSRGLREQCEKPEGAQQDCTQRDQTVVTIR